MEAPQLADVAVVEELRGRSAFDALAKEWNALVDETQGSFFVRHEQLQLWLSQFAPEGKLSVLVLRGPSGTLEAALPLMDERSKLYGIPVRQKVVPVNPHSCRFDLLARAPQQAGRAFLRHLRADASWDLLRLMDIPEGGAAHALFAEAERTQFPVGTWASQQSPYFPLPGTLELFEASLQAKFKANCRRRRKKLEEKGPVEMECFTGGPALAAKLEEGFLLEQSGWKGQRGTAMTQDARTRGFYTSLAQRAAQEGQLALYFLRVAGRAVAFQFGLIHQGRYLLLKPAYDENLKECSPGQLLMQEVVKDLIAKGTQEFDFLGPDMVWKRDWTQQVRPHHWLFIFRDSHFGRALHAAKFRWAPWAKEVVTRWKS